MALKIGITGGIGSGKSTVSRVFQLLGVPVFEADSEAKKLMNTSGEIKEALIRCFGKRIYREDKTLNRKKLAELIFNHERALKQVNEIVHPAVRKAFMNWAAQQNAPYVLHEAAILFESGFYRMMDYTLLVWAPEEQRLARVMQRDGISETQIRQRMARQWDDEAKKKLADYIIQNDNTTLLIPQIIAMDKKIKEHGKIW